MECAVHFVLKSESLGVRPQRHPLKKQSVANETYGNLGRFEITGKRAVIYMLSTCLGTSNIQRFVPTMRR